MLNYVHKNLVKYKYENHKKTGLPARASTQKVGLDGGGQVLGGGWGGDRHLLRDAVLDPLLKVGRLPLIGFAAFLLCSNGTPTIRK